MDEEEEFGSMKNKAKSLPLIFLVPITVLYILIFCASDFVTTFSFPIHGIFRQEHRSNITTPRKDSGNRNARCSDVANGTVCCDRSDYHSDVCFVRGDVRTDTAASSILLFSNSSSLPEEKIRPYTRKWETFIMNKIPELHIKVVSSQSSSSSSLHNCDVRHDVPGIFFSAGGYTGNVFHAFNDGLMPLYATSRHLGRRVVFVVLQYHHWWHTKYREILSQLSDHPLVDLSSDTRVHCFPEAIVGLRVLSVDNRTMMDFRGVIEMAYGAPGKRGGGKSTADRKPKMVILPRSGTRAMENEEGVVRLSEEVGFDVEVLRLDDAVPMGRIYRALSSCDVMMGVHGAQLTHFLFMSPGSLFVQVVPLGLEEVARRCYGELVAAIGVRYEEYRVLPRESSLRRKYREDDPVVRDPESVKAKGWEVTKEVYLAQNVTLDIARLREHLVRAFEYAATRKKRASYHL